MKKLTDDLKALRDLDDDALLDHVQAQHLIAYAEGRLDERMSGEVHDHLQGCEVCREAAELCRATATSRIVDTDRPRAARPGGLWDWLRQTLLAPAPAAAYLLLVIALAGWWAVRPATLGPGARVLPPGLPLFAEDTLRGTDAEPKPVALAAREGQPVVLLLHTDLSPGDLTGPLVVRVESDGAALLEERIPPDRLPPDGVVTLVLPPGSIAQDRVYRATVEGPGALPFAATFRIEFSL